MTQTELEGRVARALCEAWQRCDTISVGFGWEEIAPAAIRTVLMAIANPSEGMLAATDSGQDLRAGTRRCRRSVWRVMHAALMRELAS